MDNALISTLVGAAIIGGLGWLWRKHQDDKDSNAIMCFLINSSNDTPHTFRSTEAIASDTNLAENRVAAICAKHPGIKRNTKEKQSWQLA
jgi:hypothetical protein